jgi:hypothetical protein
MTSKVPRERKTYISVDQPGITSSQPGVKPTPGVSEALGQSISKLLVSEGHYFNRDRGCYVGGGPFFVVHSGDFVNPGHVSDVTSSSHPDKHYSGPVINTKVNDSSIAEHYGSSDPKEMDEKSMNSDGATAIAQCAPTNPTANLSTSLAESFREGIPSLPGIQSWKRRTEILRNAGSEYLNAEFGWKPLVDEVHNVVHAARFHRDIMHNYRHNEGRDVHRSFRFSSEHQRWEKTLSPKNPVNGILDSSFCDPSKSAATRSDVAEFRRDRWFEGCFTYGGPGKADNFSRAIGFGSEADAVYGLNLDPEVLWELTPWSWAVDWFTNTGDVIHNVSAFAAAGLVMRYGFMMYETHESHHTEWSDGPFYHNSGTWDKPKLSSKYEGAGSRGVFRTTKSRSPANPFGFGIGWEDLSPTQLAITAAIGITRLL